MIRPRRMCCAWPAQGKGFRAWSQDSGAQEGDMMGLRRQGDDVVVRVAPRQQQQQQRVSLQGRVCCEDVMPAAPGQHAQRRVAAQASKRGS